MAEEETTTENNSSELIENANNAAERLEAANEKQEELLNRQEELYAKQRLGGKSTIKDDEEKPKEETDKEYAQRIEDEMREGKYND